MIFPPKLLAPLFAIDTELLRHRYLEALEAITGKRTKLESFHVDAMGYSPEIAVELQDPHYLGHGGARPWFLVVSLEQLGGPVAHPGAGFAIQPFRRMARDLAGELASLTLGSPVIGELRHGSPRLADAGRLAALDSVGIAPGITGMRLEDARVLHRMGRELVESPTRWCDDDFIARMIPLAESARGWSKMVESLEERHYPTGSFFHPALGGTYVFELGEGGKRRVVVLSAATDPAPSEVEGAVRVLLDEGNALDFLTEEDLAGFEQSEAGLAPQRIENKLFWIGVDFLLQAEGPGALRGLTPGTIERRVRGHASAPEDFLELEEVRFGLARGGKGPSFSALTPRTALRLLTPRSEREGSVEATAHLLAWLDPVDWSTRLRDAPDLFYPRYAAQPAELREDLARFIV